jgi:hypothetical protein
MIKNTAIVFLLTWVVVYLMLCVSYIGILNPIQWIIDFPSYGEVNRNLIVFLALPLWLSFCVLFSPLVDDFLRGK